MNYVLRETWMGSFPQDIGADLKTPVSAEEIETTVSVQSRQLVADVLDGIVKRAKTGDLEAVAWLESRGLLEMPDHSDDGSVSR